jgi:hypothetical protein
MRTSWREAKRRSKWNIFIWISTINYKISFNGLKHNELSFKKTQRRKRFIGLETFQRKTEVTQSEPNIDT